MFGFADKNAAQAWIETDKTSRRPGRRRLGEKAANKSKNVMGKRSAIATTDAEAAALTLAELNQQITWTELRTESMKSASLRRSAFKRLVWLEEQRELLHGVPAPKRKF